MDKKMVEEKLEAAVVDNAAEFHKSLKELREFSSQLYHAADYCKTAFLSSKDKTQILETTKDYVSRAVVVVVDHLGSMSAKLECCISKSNSVSETECKLERLMQRIGMCQNYSYKISLHRFHLGADFSRYHCHYISPQKGILLNEAEQGTRSTTRRDQETSQESFNKVFVASCNSKGSIDAKNEEETPSEGVELLESEMKKHNVAPAPLVTSRNYQNLVPVDDGLSILPKTKNSAFQFKEREKRKRSSINWKVRVQNKDIAALIKRGKRLLT